MAFHNGKSSIGLFKGLNMLEFPVVFPLDSTKLLIGRLTGQNTASVRELHNAAWEVWGYAARQVHDQAGPLVWATTLVTPSEEELKQELEFACQCECPQGNVVTAGKVDWLKIVMTLLKFLPLFLEETKP
jgi:hypothetical protein